MFMDQCDEDMLFLERSLDELGWIKSNSSLLITGLAGMNFIEELLRRFPKLRIIATDKEPHVIESARLYNASENVTYCVADIGKRETLQYWFGTARKILSYHNLERTTDVKAAFKNFYSLLAPEGTIAVRFSPNNPLFNCIKEVSFRWRQFVHDLEIKSQLPVSEEVSDSSFRDMLGSIGFEILYFRNVNDSTDFESEVHCKNIMATETSQVSYVSTDTTGFLEMVISKLGWSDLSDDIVMDLGCGNPKIKFSNILVNLFPNVKQVLCIDKNSMMIHYLKISKRPSNIVYQCADIENRSTLIKWEGQISKIVSTHCFHMLQDQKTGFQNIYRLLKPGGEAAILFCVQSGYVGWHCELRDDTKWNKYYNGNAPEIPTTQFMKMDDSNYRTMLEEMGFRIILCEKDKIGVPFESVNAWKDLILKLALSSFDIPEDLKEEFKKDLFGTFMKHNCKTDKGLPCQSSHFLTALLRKPDIMNN